MDSIGQRIRMARDELGWNQKKLAEMSGFWAPDLSDWERGKTNPKIETIVKLARAMDKPMSYFLVDPAGTRIPLIDIDRIKNLIASLPNASDRQSVLSEIRIATDKQDQTMNASTRSEAKHVEFPPDLVEGMTHSGNLFIQRLAVMVEATQKDLGESKQLVRILLGQIRALETENAALKKSQSGHSP